MTIECHVWERCGGCPLMGHGPREQIQTKTERVRQIFSQADLGWPADLKWIGSPTAYDYRNRVRLDVQAGRVGFFNPEKVSTCAVLEPALRELLEEICSLSQSSPHIFSDVAHLELRGRDLDGRWGLYLTLEEGGAFHDSDMPDDFDFELLIGTSVGPVPFQRFAVGRHCYGLTPLSSFIQVNHGVNRMLVNHVVDGALRRGVHRFLDLFCGSGNFALALASVGLVGHGFELDAIAVEAANKAASDQSLDQVDFRALDLRTGYGVLEAEELDLLVLNPPRAGLKDGVESLARLNARFICLCECSPDSLAKDVVRLQSLGYALTEMTLFDMFPHTQHVESMAWLSRAEKSLPGA